MKTIFFGSSGFAVPALRALAASHDVRAVFTQPDRPAGRKLRLTPTPIKAAAQSLGLDVFMPERLDAAFASLVEGLHPQLLACVAYGKILPPALLDIPGMSALNAHPSLLPQYRGAAPIQAALREGRSETGVTIIWMSAEMDAGDIALSRAAAILPDDDYGTLHDRLAGIAADLMLEAAAQLAAGTLPRMPQEHGRATYVRPLSKADLRLRFDQPAPQVANFVRSASPTPGAWLVLGGKRVKVLAARAEPAGAQTAELAPGEIVELGGDGPLIACSPGALRLLRVVPEGRAPGAGAEFARALERRSGS